MTEKDVYKPVIGEEGKIIAVLGKYPRKRMESTEELIDELNDKEITINVWRKSAEKMKKLLYEKLKPTYRDNVYLDIDKETKRCKYENTHICLDFKCDYYSTYFLNCRLMMGDGQLRKAKELGLWKGD